MCWKFQHLYVFYGRGLFPHNVYSCLVSRRAVIIYTRNCKGLCWVDTSRPNECLLKLNKKKKKTRSRIRRTGRRRRKNIRKEKKKKVMRTTFQHIYVFYYRDVFQHNLNVREAINQATHRIFAETVGVRGERLQRCLQSHNKLIDSQGLWTRVWYFLWPQLY